MLIGLLAIPVLQVMQNVYAGWWWITATAGSNGSITPSWIVAVGDWLDQEFTMTPDATYGVKDIVIDGSSRWVSGGYTFASVSASHTIDVTFDTLPHITKTTMTCNFSKGFGMPSEGILKITVDRLISELSPYENLTVGGIYYPVSISSTMPKDWVPSISTVAINLWSALPDGSYVLDIAPNTKRNGILDLSPRTVNFVLNCNPVLSTFDIMSAAGIGWTIDPLWKTTYNSKDDAIYTITPDYRYEIDALLIDKVPTTPTTSYTFTSIDANHDISVTFKAITNVWWWRAIDNCRQRSSLSGANTGWIDYSPSHYDHTCLAPEQVCTNVASCLDFPTKVRQLIDLNNLLTNKLQIFFWQTPTEVTKLEFTSIIDLLHYMASKLWGLSSTVSTNLSKIFTKTTTTKTTATDTTFIDTLNKMAEDLQSLNDNILQNLTNK